ncbi:MAG: ATP-dependent DNA ligase [Microthrixaceae bacterium]|nr:ATP-dependent DNA ligase [Microthrixaceae bacterium]
MARDLGGDVLYEPKWDGVRLIVVVDDEVSLWSRQGKNLTRAFPELVAAATEQLPDGVIVDGEAVIWSESRLDFDALLRRINVGRSRAEMLARAQPAAFAAFDLLAVDGRDIRGLQLRDRRVLLEELARIWAPPLNLSPVTQDQAEAAEWFQTLTAAGIEGVIAKGAADPYVGGHRAWVKVKHRETRDVICAAVTGSRDRPSELVVGLPADGGLRIVGRTTPLRARDARMLGELLEPPASDHPWPEVVKPGVLDRFNRDRGPVTLTLVDPLVVEISADVAMLGGSFRHAVRFVRARPDVPVDEVVP